MVSISHVVEDIVKHRPYLSESLAAGIINVSSLARQLQPDVERALQKGVNTGAIVMALNRLAPYLQVREQVQLNKLLSNMGDIILRSSLCDYTFKNSPTLLDCHIEVLKNLVKNDEIFYTMVQGVFETNLVISDTMEELIADYFKDELCLFKKKRSVFGDAEIAEREQYAGRFLLYHYERIILGRYQSDRSHLFYQRVYGGG